MNLANLNIAVEKCIGCGLCTKVCPNSLLYLDAHKKAMHRPITEFGWDGCWKCQHCLAVCPEGAISVLDKKPENSLLRMEEDITAQALDSLIVNRRSHRRYLRKNVDKSLLMHMLTMLQNAPNGGNKQQVEYTLINDIEQMDYIRALAYGRMEELAQQGIYAEGFDEKSYYQLKAAEKSVRPDMLFCGAAHLLIPHAPTGSCCIYQTRTILVWQSDLGIRKSDMREAFRRMQN